MSDAQQAIANNSCRCCGDRIDPRNCVQGRDGFLCLPCEDDRARELTHYMTTED